MVSTALSHVYPLGSRLDERGRLQLGGCDAIELAREFGTPAYVVVEDDLRARARAFVAALAAQHGDGEVVFASKAFPCTAVLELFAAEGLMCDVASAGELHLALNAGFAPERIVVHGNARDDAELAGALARRVGLIVVDNFDDIDRLERLTSGRRDRDRQDVLVRVTPGVAGETHASISTGQPDSKFGLGVADARGAIERLEAAPGLRLLGLHMHIGSQLLDLAPFRAATEVLATLGDFPVYDLGGGLGVAYSDSDEPPSVDDYVAAQVDAVRELIGPGKRILLEPGRALVANAGVTLYSVVSVKRNVSTWVGVDGGMSDNLRPMLYGSHYEAQIADRFGDATSCHVTGKHCESGDVIVRDARLQEPRSGDVLVTPATGAYGHAMANNYNGVPRPPVVFVSEGEARVVVRRETVEELTARDVR
ncbi:MAG TPA: diaminopimelate decarboxylase [Solirubrobacteraceae bacterium]|jgi:diaminopimelate decarboxylase|nr:diaminopimelate decarboxylase [Solirubrobacteraceae bacterium]